MRASIMGLSGLLFALTSLPAFAQDAEEESSPITVSANVALTTDYRFRGIGFSDGDIAVQGGVDVSHDSGFYVGAWASSIEDSPTFGHTELDLYGGWSGEVADGLNADVGLLYYAYPNGKVGDAEFFEPYAKLSGTIGPAEITIGAAYAWDQKALAGDNLYWYADASVGIPNTPVTLNGHLGFNEGSLSVSTDNDYTDFSIGADYVITKNLTANLSYVSSDTDTPSVDGFTDDAIVFTLSANF